MTQPGPWETILASEAAWMAARGDSHVWGPVVAAIRKRHGLSQESEALPFATGSAAVWDLGSKQVLKIFHPRDGADCERERASFELAGPRLDVPLPRALAWGEERGFPYLLMSRLDGRPLAECWAEMADGEREGLLSDLGAVTRRLHGLALPSEAPYRLDWAAHLDEQRQSAAQRQRSKGLAPELCAGIDSFLEARSLPANGELVLLHTELMRDHVMVTREEGGGFKLSGLFDFAEAITGPPEYDFASVGLFVSEGRPELLRAFLRGYGYEPEALSLELSCRLMAYALIHRYGNLPWYLRRMPPPEEPGSMEYLASCWFGL